MTRQANTNYEFVQPTDNLIVTANNSTQTDTNITQSRQFYPDEGDDVLFDQPFGTTGIRWSNKKHLVLILKICSPVACFWALNLSIVANTKIQSVTL
jgi:hypothetical protein